MSATFTLDAAAVAERIVETVPASNLAFTQLLGLLDVQLDPSVPTAGITLGARPRLVLNPFFLEQHCRSDAALMMLVLHELNHVLYGHTRLYTHTDPAHNVVFDALINAQLCRTLPGLAYTALFRDLYRPDVFPEALLRPPVSWGTPEVRWELRGLALEAHQALYGGDTVTQAELFELLTTAAGGAPGGDAGIGPERLLGTHGDAPTDQPGRGTRRPEPCAAEPAGGCRGGARVAAPLNDAFTLHRPDAAEPAGAWGMGAIYVDTHDGRRLRRADWTDGERASRMAEFYHPYHRAMSELVLELRGRFDAPAHIIDLHSFPEQPFPYETDREPRPRYCLGYTEEHVPLGWVAWWESRAAESPGLLAHNRPFAGSFVPDGLDGGASFVRSLMVEVNRSLLPAYPGRDPLPEAHARAGLVREFLEFACEDLFRDLRRRKSHPSPQAGDGTPSAPRPRALRPPTARSSVSSPPGAARPDPG